MENMTNSNELVKILSYLRSPNDLDAMIKYIHTNQNKETLNKALTVLAANDITVLNKAKYISENLKPQNSENNIIFNINNSKVVVLKPKEQGCRSSVREVGHQFLSKVIVSCLTYTKDNNLELLNSNFRLLWDEMGDFLQKLYGLAKMTEESDKKAVTAYSYLIECLEPKYQNYAIEKYKNTFVKNGTAFTFANILMQNNELYIAESFIDTMRSLSISGKDDSKFISAFHKLSTKFDQQNNHYRSFSNLIKAYTLKPNNPPIIKDIIDMASRFNKLEFAAGIVNALVQCNNKDKNLNLLQQYLYLHTDANKIDRELLKKLKSEDIDPAIRALLTSTQIMSKYSIEQSVENNKFSEEFNQTIKSLQTQEGGKIVALKLYMHFNKTKEAQKFIDQVPLAEINANTELALYKSKLSIAKNLITKINEYSFHDTIKANLHYHAAIKFITADDIEMGSRHIAEAKRLDPKNQTYSNTWKMLEALTLQKTQTINNHQKVILNPEI